MAFVGLLLVAILLGLVLRRALRKPSFIRERAPLQPLQGRSPKYPPSDSYLLCSNHASTALLQADGGMFDNVPDSSSSVTLKGFTIHTEGLTDTKLGVTNRGYQSTMPMLRVPSQSQLSHAYSQNSLHRSVSQLIDTQDKKSLAGLRWDTERQGTDSGMYVGDEEFADSLKGFSSLKKEHAVFTDTHL
ncbi:usherin-like [Silurus meridionalis]|uniref:usherin-like n=1 Tax=Silurus meridionalis TaxID=175797 RepID=UPI001EEA6316|nr:usherin-like [Silurus meridionalis]